MSEKRIRLLICHLCGSVDEIPWCGEELGCQHPDCVAPLEYRVANHLFPSGRPHPMDLGDVPKKKWDQKTNRYDILQEIGKHSGPPGTGAGMGVQNYSVQQTFEEDAFACWKRHNRTTDCGEFQSDRMRLIPDTKAERKDLGLETRAKYIPTQVFLCNYCPMMSVRQTKVRAKKGEYDDPYK